MSATIGEQLRQARERKGLSIEQAARMTNLRVHYLEALENDQRDRLPSNVQGRGFLRLYAGELGLPVEPLLLAWEGKAPPPEPAAPPAPAAEAAADETESAAEGLPGSGPLDSGPLDSGPQVSGPQVSGPQVSGPQIGAAHDGGAPGSTASEGAAPLGAPPAGGLPSGSWGSASAATGPALPAEPLYPSAEIVAGLAGQEEEFAPDEPVFVQQDAFRPAGDQPSGSQAVFEEIGQILRTQRELLGLSRAEVERYTRLRQHYIQALEEGRMEGLPSPVQGRGMLSNYAEFLNLNEERLLLRFAEGLQLRRVERVPAREPQGLFTPAGRRRPAREAGAWRRFITPDLIFGVVLAAAVLFFIVWTVAEVSDNLRAAGAQPTTPPLSEVLLSTPFPSPGTAQAGLPGGAQGTEIAGQSTSEAGPTSSDGLTQATLPAGGEDATPDPDATAADPDATAGPTEQGSAPQGGPTPTLRPLATQPSNATPTLPPLGNAPLEVYIVARQRAYLLVVADGKVEFQGRTVPGNAYAFSGSKRIEVTSGNAAALQVFYNSSDLGTLGTTGQALGLVFEPGAMMTPTPAFTNTPTATPPATVTPLPSPTLAATPTITPFVPR